MGSPFDAFPDATQAPQPPAAPKAMTASIWDAFPDAPKPPASAPREASGLLESLQAGFQGSASGLMWRNKLPDIFVNPDNSSWLERLASGLGQVGSEIGIMIPAAIPGSMAGSAVGGPVGGLLGAGFAMGAVPAAIRTAYMEALKSGEVKDGPGFWNIVGEVTKQALKEGTINAAAMGAGAWAKAALATRAGATAEASKAIAVGAASPLTQKAAIGYEATDLATQVTAMTTMAAWSQGHLYPSLQEVGDAAILIGGLKGAHVAAKRIMDVYEKTGKTPAEQAADAQRDPTIAEDLTKPPEPKPGDGQRSPTLSRKESQTVVSDSAFNGDSATGLENIFRSDEYDGAPIGLGSKGFTPDEIAGLERAGMATDGTMSPDQFALYDAERSARLAGRSSLKRPPPAEVPRETDGRVAMPSIQEALFRETARIDELELKARADATPLSDAERVELVGLKAKVSDLEAQLSERAKAPPNVADIVDAKFTDEQLAGARKLADDRIQELTTKAESGALTDTERTERIFLTNSLDKPGNLAKHFAIEPAGKLAPTPEAREASAQRVFEDVLGQVKAADDARRASGLAPLGEEHAQAVAALVRARVRTRAARLGVLPEDIYNEKPLQIRDETSTEVAAAEAAIPPEAPRFLPPEVDLFGNPVEVTNAPRYAVENMATTEVPLANLVLSKEVPQFKNAADAQGVVIPLGGKFDRTGVGPIQVWERLDGTLEVISGRHRLDLARRSGEETIPAQIHREADGFDARQAATLDAQLNIREEQGSVADYAQYFKDSGLSKEAADERGLLARAKGRTGFAIARDASPDLLQAHRAGKLSDEAALSISTAAPGSERLQALGIAQVNEGKSILFAVNTMKAVDLMAAERMARGDQGDLFGMDDSAMREAAAMAKKASSKQRAISEQISAVSGASKRPELARKLGVDVQDPEGIQKKIVELKQEQYLWDNWPLYPELVAKLRELNQDPTGKDYLPVEMLAKIFDETRWLDRGLKIGKKAKLYRGEDDKTGSRVGSEGRGLYVTTDRAQAKGYGAVKAMEYSDLPQNPIRFRDAAMFQEWKRFIVRELGYSRESEFEAAYSPHADEWIRTFDPSIDGVQIGTGAGAFFVKFPASKNDPLYQTNKSMPSNWFDLKPETPSEAAKRDEEAVAQAVRRMAGPDSPGFGLAQGNALGLWPDLRVRVQPGLKIPDKPLILQATNNLNAPRQIAALDPILEAHPNATDSMENWAAMTAQAFASREVPVPPYAFLKDINGPRAVEKLQKLTAGQIADADHGFQNTAEFRRAYTAGELGVETTGKLFMWSFLSRGVSPYTQESLFIDAFKGADEWIAKAARGEFTEADFPAYEAWAKSVAPAGSGQPGSGATHNLNAFGRNFLFKMGQLGADGKSHLQRLHDMMADPNTTGREIRREFVKFGEGVGIDNKVVSFTLLVAGHADVMVLDRVQIRNLWDDGRFKDVNLYDGANNAEGKRIAGSGMADLTTGARGLLYYEALERGLAKKLPEIYGALGRPQDASLGRYHWETWVAASEQEASHGTLGAILADARGDDTAIARVSAKQGEYGAYEYGAEYNVTHGSPGFSYETPSGKKYEFSVPAFRMFLGELRDGTKAGPGVIPTGFKVTQSGNAPWYDRKGVNREKLDDLASKWADRAGGSGEGERALAEAAAAKAPADRERSPEEVAFANEGNPNLLYQSDKTQPRGSFQVAEHLITTMAGADKSTVVHELAHSWLEELKTDAARPDAPAQIKQDWAIVRHELGIGEDGNISRASHEQWARTSERYLGEGVAPTRELQGVFDRFKTWLLEIYNSLGNLKAEVNPELKAVLDRMLATDEELAMAKELGVPRAYVPEANAARIAAIVPPEQARAKIQPGFEAERASMEPFTDELPTGPGEAPDTTRVNYEYINAPEDVKRAMQGLAEIDQANIQKRRGGVEGVESWEATNEKVAQEMADVLEGDPRALDKYVNDVLGASATQPKVNEVLRRMKVILTGAAKDSAARRDVILSKGLDASIKEQLEYLGSLERLRMIQNEFLGQRAAVARALNQLKDTTEGTGEVGRMLEAIGVGADEVLLQSGRTPEQEQAAMKMALDEILLRYKDKSGNIRTPLDIAKLHKEIGTLKGSFKLAETMEKAGKWEKFVEGWKAGLLSGPQTPVVNLFGTASFEFMRPAVDALSAIIGMARGASPGMGETDRASMSEAVARLTGMVGGIQDGLKVGYAALKVDQQTGKVESYRPAIEGKLGEIIRMPYRLMAAGDQVTTTMYSRGEIASLAIRQAFDEGLSPGSREFAERVQALKDKPLPEMQAIADEAAARMTFNSPGGEKMRAVQTFVSKWNLEWMVPFIRTPMNVAEEMLRMSPFAPAVTSWRADIAKGGVARDRAIAELTLGAGIMALTTAYAFSGQISGSGSPDPGKNRAKAGVWQANSWLIGDTWYEYGRIQPVGTLMALAADMATTWDMMNDEERDKIPKMLALAFSNAITNQTFLQGITNVVHLMSEPDRYGGRFLQGLAGSMVPNVIGQPTAMSDPYVRQVNSMLDAVQSRIPGLRQELAPKVDWLGEPTPTKERVGVVGPSRTQKVSDDPVRKEAKRLNISVADAPKKTHIGKGTGNLGDVELTPEERTKFAEVGGKFAHDILANIVTAPGYDAIPDMVKKRIFSKVLSASHKIAAVAALPPDKRMQYLQSITEKVAQELTPEAE